MTGNKREVRTMAMIAERMLGVGIVGGVTEEKCWKGGTVVKKVCADGRSECSFLSLKLLGFCSMPGNNVLGDKAQKSNTCNQRC